jgi:hypothetical protein
MNLIIDKQNTEMLKILEDEQEAENKREEKFVRASL